MKLKINDVEYYIKEDTIPSNFDSMTNNKRWNYIIKNKLLHRENEPAIIYSNGGEEWYLNGKKHRLNGSAKIWADNTKWYYLNDILVDEEIYKKIQSSTKEDLLVYMIDPNYKDFLSLIEYELNKD